MFFQGVCHNLCKCIKVKLQHWRSYSYTVHETQQAKLLGLKISNDLCWKAHVKDVCTELDQRIGVLKRLQYVFSRKNLQMLADGLVMSKIRYGISIYSQTRLLETDPQIGLIQKLQVKQNKAMRIVLKKRCLDKVSTESLLEQMGLLSDNQMTVKMW